MILEELKQSDSIFLDQCLNLIIEFLKFSFSRVIDSLAHIHGFPVVISSVVLIGIGIIQEFQVFYVVLLVAITFY